MIDEIKKSVSATLYERLASPLLGSFIASWCIWNYKVFLIIFSSLEYDKQVEKLDAYFARWYYCRTFSIPLLWVLFYIFIYPRIAKYVFKKWQKYIADKEMIRQYVKKDVPITVEQANEIKQNLAKQSVVFEELLKDKNERIKSLEERDSKNQNRIEEKDKEVISLKEQLQKLIAANAAFMDRNKMIEDYEITPGNNGLMHSNNGLFTGTYLCPSCLNSSPPKLIPINDEAHHSQQHVKCPSCGGEYPNRLYSKEELSKLPHLFDNDFQCWMSCNKRTKHCPNCAISHNDLNFSELAKISDNEYKCILCQKTYKKASVA